MPVASFSSQQSPSATRHKASQLAWNSLVGGFENYLCLLAHKPGTLPRLSSYLYTRTGGHIGSLAQLVKKAAISAIIDHTERITKDLLETITIDIAAHTSQASRKTAKRKTR